MSPWAPTRHVTEWLGVLDGVDGVLAAGVPRVDHQRVPPDLGCYEERYRLTGSAALGLAASLLSVGPGLLWRTPVIFTLAALLLAVVALRAGACSAPPAG